MLAVMPTQSTSPPRVGVRHRSIERDWELTTLAESLKAAGEGVGSTVVIEAPAGTGHTQLLNAAHEMAVASELQILRAAGSRLEGGFPFGLALQLVEPAWVGSPPERRRELLHGPGGRAAPLLADDPAPQVSETASGRYELIHGLFWIVAGLAGSSPAGPPASGSSPAGRPAAGSSPAGPPAAGSSPAGGHRAMAIIVDDLQWADAPSLRFLAYLAERLRNLPIALVVAARAGEPSADPPALAGLRRSAGERLLRPAPLSDGGSAELVRRHFPGAAAEFCAACASATGGNPLLLGTLLDELHRQERAPSAATAAAIATIVPERIGDAVTARLQAMSPAARSVARAAAVLGDDATVRRVALLGGLDRDTVLGAADALAAAHLLAPDGPLSFAQPLLHSAVLASLQPFERARSHLGAARILTEQHADPHRIARHLLLAPPDDDPAAIAPLREAAQACLADGDAVSAAALLERALAENPPGDERARLLAELGAAESSAGLPQAAEHLGKARRLTADPRARAELALAEGQALYGAGRYRHAAETLAAGATELRDADPRIGADLTATYICAASMVGELRGQSLRLRERMLSALSDRPSRLQRQAIAHTAVHDGLLGAPRAKVSELCALAWGDGDLLGPDAPLDLGPALLCAALVVADELERAVEIGDRVLEAGPELRSSAAGGLVSAIRAWALHHQGRVRDAEADAEAALALRARDGSASVRCLLAVIASCHIEQGRLEQAESILAPMDPDADEPVWDTLLLHTRARLRLAQRRPQEALADALQAGSRIEAIYADASPGGLPWRSTAAIAQLALGEPKEARSLAGDELARARKLGLTRVMIRDLRILGLTLNSQGIPKLAAAVQTGDSYPDRLEHVRALIDYGAALRRRNRRADAREPLRRGLDLSHRGGAAVLESRAQTELTASGARPRRSAASGPLSLTASQGRVAALAVQGLTTRQIAEALFVTPKTVEFHLRQTYQKLGVASRDELSEALGNDGR